MIFLVVKWLLIACLIIFFFVDIFTGFFISKFIRLFIFSIPLFIRDCIGRDKEVFPGFGFWCYSGLGGSGKTISLVDYLNILKSKYPKLKIFTNFKYNRSDGHINSWSELLSSSNFSIEEINEKDYKRFIKYKTYSECKGEIWREVDSDFNLKYFVNRNHGIVFGFDEIHLTFASTNWEDAPDNLLDYISQQRKFHKLIIASSQVFTRIDKKLREQTNYVVECSSFLGGRLVLNQFFDTATYICNDEKLDKGNKKRRPKKRQVFIATDEIRNSYDTEEIMKDLTIKSNKSRLMDLIDSYRRD